MKRQRLLRASGVHPVGDEPVVVAVGIAGPTRRQHPGQSPSRREGRRDLELSDDKFDIDRDRTEAQNLGFGYGIHSCLGAALARMESAIALDKLLDFMPRYEVIWEGCRRVSMQNVAGWSNVPVRVLR